MDVENANASQIDIVKEFLNYDSESRTFDAPVKNEFQTTTQYQKQLTALAAKRRKYENSARFFALVRIADFSFDADRQQVTFFYCAPFSVDKDRCHHDEWGLAGSSAPVPDDPLHYENFQIIPVDHKNLSWPSVTLSTDGAKSLVSHRLRLAVIVSLQGVPTPVLSGSVDYDTLVALTLPPMTDQANREFEKAFDRFDKTRFKLTARVVRVVVFDLDSGGVRRPLFDWQASVGK